jgi:hypothetical protein
MWSLVLLDSSLCTRKSNLFLLDSSLCTRKSTSFWLLRLQFWWGGRMAAKWHKDHMITRKPTDANQWKHANQVCVASQGQNTSSCMLLSVWIWATFLALNCPTNSKIHIQTFHIIWLLYYSQLLSSFFAYLVWKWAGSHVTSWLKTPHCFDGLFWYSFDTVIAKI